MLSHHANPFPGLRPFDTDDAGVFFGRAELVDQVILRLSRSRLLVVTGRSGAGKSSLLRAGVVPTLLSGFQTPGQWRIATLRPGATPLTNLAEALCRIEGVETANTETVLQTLQRHSRGLVEAVMNMAAAHDINLLIVVDQFEEIFRHASPSAADEAASFVQLLLEACASQSCPVYVVMSVRTDFLEECEHIRGLPEALSESLLLVPRMSRENLRESIIGPIRTIGAEIEPALVYRLLNEAGDERAELGVFQHVLHQTLRKWHDSGQTGPIREEHYELAGTIARALELELEFIFESQDSKAQRIVKRTFQRVIERDSTGRRSVRPTLIDELSAIAGVTRDDVIRAIEPFQSTSGRYLISTSHHVDVSHAAILGQWRRLHDWVEEERRSVNTYIQLASAAMLFPTGETGYLRNPELAHFTNWRKSAQPNRAWAERHHPEFEVAMAFLANSEKADTRRRSARTLLMLSGLIGTAFLLAQYFR